MKRSVFAVFTVFILVISGCATPHPEIILPLAQYSSAMVENKDGDVRIRTKEVSVKTLTPILVRAKWIDHGVISMGGFWITYPNGQRIFIAVGFEFFRVEGVRGHFDIRTEDIPAYHQAIDLIRRRANQALEPTTLSVTNPAEPGFAPAKVVAHL